MDVQSAHWDSHTHFHPAPTCPHLPISLILLPPLYRPLYRRCAAAVVYRELNLYLLNLMCNPWI